MAVAETARIEAMRIRIAELEEAVRANHLLMVEKATEATQLREALHKLCVEGLKAVLYPRFFYSNHDNYRTRFHQALNEARVVLHDTAPKETE